MAYRLRSGESIAKGLKRVVRKELRAAVDQLSAEQAPEEAIHEARKSIKKVRAILQLIGKDIHAGHALDDLRHAGHLLAPLRDADALLGSAKTLCARDGRSRPEQACSALRQRLTDEKARVRAAEKGVKRRAVESLADTRRSSKKWDWNNVGSSAFETQLRRSYKKARRTMRQSRDENRPETFHTWRKRIKTLWYALRLVETRVRLGRRLTDLKRLETWLGEDHNLAVLRTHIGTTDGHAGAMRLKGLVDQRQQGLRRKALALGARRFRDKPKQFARHVQTDAA